MLIPVLIFLVVAQLLLPGYFLYALWRGKDRDLLAWLVKVLYSGAYFLLIFLFGRWDWLSNYLVPLLILLFVAALVASIRRVRGLPFIAQRDWKGWVSFGSAVLTLLLFGFLLTVLGRAFFYEGEPVRVAFPLRDRRYYVGQGGNSPYLNYHNTNTAQRYAIDVVALNGAGARARGIVPSSLAGYAIFGATVHSPCDGTVTTAVGDLPDRVPPAADRENLAGNHLVITCRGVKILLAHMQQGSLTVRAGERVVTGQSLGRVGNSGNTSEPHLHIHAVPADAADVLSAPGVPLLFEGTFPVRNMVLFR